ncbi:alpha-2-macroglobulin [Niveispirillum sp.]|uniref:alpha-2-macroglobulin family protein n=1 Tax=Niveispirillum sp. TaxID=1917217 RepID=UPI001B4C6A4C|nr:alpha-2-macroglobulin [Niveispirillum sp.]MBP7338440.1 alpha-2-macroglobulin family protein [Niveispirillum sp.]
MPVSKRVALSVAIVATVAVGAYAGWKALRGDGGQTATTVADTVAPPSTKPVTATSVAPVADDRIFRFTRVTTEAGGAVAEACLVFSKPLDETGGVNYADYVDLPAEVKAGFRVAREKLCLSGLGFGREYDVGLRPGLPAAANGGTLAEAQNVTLALNDRPPAVALGQGFILPRETGDGLPITTVNVERLSIKLYRVGDRMLARMRQDFVDERSIYPYSARDVQEDEGRLVWQGEIPVQGPRNSAVTTLFPLTEAVGKTEPGAYLLVASNPDAPRQGDEGDYYYSDDYRPQAGQWVVQSDLGVTSFRGDDGLTLSIRSLASAKPLSGVRLSLVARNNEVLGEVKSDGKGMARFDAGLLRGEGGMAPVMIMAYGAGGDFNFLDLRRPGFDLSDRGVDGRRPAGAADAFLYTERGIYRPGESVELTTLLRNQEAMALPGRRLTIKVNRPDGKEHQRFEVPDQGGAAGHLSITLPVSANRGQWEAAAHADPEGPAIGSVRFQVQDFVPQRLEVAIDKKPARLSPGEALSLDVNARFLYGAPGAALAGEAKLTLEPDPAPFPRHKGFRWGVAAEAFDVEPVDLTIEETDPEGKTRVTGTVPAEVPGTQPLRADIYVAIREPGGRATAEHVYVPVPVTPLSIGIRPQFEDAVPEGAKAGFEVMAVDADGNPVAAKGLSWRMIKDTSTWQWFRSGGAWKYQRVPREKVVASGTLDVTADKPSVLSQAVTWGGYRLVVTDAASKAETAVAFSSGWYGESGPDRPDRLKLAADRAGYAPGDTARLRIDSEAAGEALLVIANETVHETRTIAVPAGGTDVEVKVGADWGPGAYALVTLYRPLTPQLGHAPVRAVGVAWLGLDAGRRTLDVAIAAPPKVLPRQTIQVPVSVAGAGKQAHLTLAAVDQGILQLTRFATPKPQDYFLAKRQLGVSMRDDYGRLIRAQAQGDDQGGDGFGGRGLDVVPTRTVALFSGIVALDATGKATIPLTIPDFQGELRLMAVAWDTDKLGSAETRLTVRDPVVAELILPRFLSPSDQGRATVLLHNVEGAAGAYRLTVSARGPVAGGQVERTIDLAAGERQVFTVPLDGTAAGIGTVSLSVSGPGGFKVDRAWPIQVRPPQLPVTREMVATLAPGENLVLPADLLDGLVPGTESVALSVSRWQGLDVPGMLRWLDRYPFGCLEQTVSRAMPLLWFNDLALMAGTRQDQAIADRVQDSVDRVLSMQDPEGGFRMWGQHGDAADPWMSVFAMDFLELASDQGFVVPADALLLGRQWLGSAATRSYPPAVRAYASWVLARKGKANAGDLRYFHDSNMPDQALAAAHLGAALDAVGERARAGQSFTAAQAQLKDWAAKEAEEERARETARRTGKPANVPVRTDTYGSRLRDTYAVASLMAAGGRGAGIPALLDSVQMLDSRAEDTNTQEKAWMLRTAAGLAPKGAKLSVAIDGAPLGNGDPVSVPVAPDRLRAGVTLANQGETGLYRTLSVEGVPVEPVPATETGITLRKSLYSTDGQPVDPAKVKQNDRIIVVVEGNAIEAAIRGDYAILDLLPAGLEVEGVIRPEQAGYGWLGRLTDPNIAEGRDDRFVAAVPLPVYREDDKGAIGVSGFALDRRWGFRVAYAVRAVTPGAFALPAAVAEHMYVPKVKARTAMGRLEIAE